MTPEAQRLIVEAAIDYVEAEVQWRRVGGPRQLQIRREAFATLRSYVEDRDHIDEMDERMDGLAASSPATAGRGEALAYLRTKADLIEDSSPNLAFDLRNAADQIEGLRPSPLDTRIREAMETP